MDESEDEVFESGFNHDDGGDSDVEPAQSFFFFFFQNWGEKGEKGGFIYVNKMKCRSLCSPTH